MKKDSNLKSSIGAKNVFCSVTELFLQLVHTTVMLVSGLLMEDSRVP